MITGTLRSWEKYSFLAVNPIFKEAFTWISKQALTADLGDYRLDNSGCLVRVMEYKLKNRETARFEHHKETIDLQYTIKGAEGIEWAETCSCVEDGEYNAETDFQFLLTPNKENTFVKNYEGNFCILFPQDAHQPQRAYGCYNNVRKLVVKIPLNILK